jgi:hypothetical protein
MDAANFLDPAIAKNDPQHDYHRSYFGETVAVTGDESRLRVAVSPPMSETGFLKSLTEAHTIHTLELKR